MSKLDGTGAPLAAGVLYYIQDPEYRGDLVLWWRPNGCGYTADIDRAGIYPAAYFDDLDTARSVPWPVEHVRARITRHVINGALREDPTPSAASPCPGCCACKSRRWDLPGLGETWACGPLLLTEDWSSPGPTHNAVAWHCDGSGRRTAAADAPASPWRDVTPEEPRDDEWCVVPVPPAPWIDATDMPYEVMTGDVVRGHNALWPGYPFSHYMPLPAAQTDKEKP